MVDNECSLLSDTIARVKILSPGLAGLDITDREKEVLRRSDGTLLPGSVLNPRGAVKHVPFSQGLVRHLMAEWTPGTTNYERIVAKLVEQAAQGDLKACELVHDYIEGKPVARNEITGRDGGAIEVNHQALLLGRIEAMIKNLEGA